MSKKLKQEVYNELRREAATVYSTSQLIRTVITSVSMNVGDVDMQGAAKYIWDSLLSVAEEQQKLEALVSYIAAEYPANAVFTKTLAGVRDMSAFMPPLNLDAYRKSPAGQVAKVFMIYANEDAKAAKELKKQLYPMVLNGEISIVDVYDVPPGAIVNDYYASAVGESDIVLLLLTSDFFSPENNCMPLAFTAIGMKKRVIPVLMEETLWGRIKVLSGIVPLPINHKPVSQWNNRAEALMRVAEGVSKVARDVKK
jgi:hypothetical protein